MKRACSVGGVVGRGVALIMFAFMAALRASMGQPTPRSSLHSSRAGLFQRQLLDEVILIKLAKRVAG